MRKHLFFLLILPCLTWAQTYTMEKDKGRGAVVGLVLDSVTLKPLSYASISLLDVETSSQLMGTICDQKGVFKLQNVPKGSYELLIEFMGYSPMLLEGLELVHEKGYTDLGSLLLNNFVEELQEVELLERNIYVVQEIDKKVFNVGQDEANSSGTALNLMQNLPSVDVDVDGNVSLRGSDQVRLFVDGKSSLQSASDLLENLPSSMIESVELITNPS
ncbi:TonB-dependent receptor, partial [Flavobacteriales bacterium]|nr:TonB-dependent receptor [Flavobacteriales bacterium]